MSIKQSESQTKRFEKTIDDRKNNFIVRANKIHNFKYSYEKVDYINSHQKIVIDCDTHGEFEQKPYIHLQGQGCPKCAHNLALTHEQFVQKSVEKYNNRYKIVSKFSGIKHNIKIECIEHGEFDIKAETHLRTKNGGCPTCALNIRLECLKPGNVSKSEKKWLDEQNVPLRQYKIFINNKFFLVDGFDPNTNTIYEFYGGYWHGNPLKYDPIEYNLKLKKTFGDLYHATIEREKLLREYYNLITFWD
jgi:hypothetical protein